ncbi:MAG: zinc-binding alcohol dehydrogenase [Armatimonadetes bacterium]|nr:zinc-binding alcohol dehydrogenase [Armatimonadota bacterium]
MALELVAVAPGQPELREYSEREPGPGEVLVRSRLATEKHGTMLLFYHGISAMHARAWDGEHGLFQPLDPPPTGRVGFPCSLGNMAVGTVAAVGPGVEHLHVGDRVFGHLPIRESHTVPASRVQLAPEGIADEALVCIDPGLVALLGIREGQVRLGDTVAIFGLGAIGLMAVQMARLAGALTVVGIEPIPLRAELARRYGADLVINPREDTDPGLRVRQATGMKGVDVSLETSGSHAALHHAVRGTCYGGTIVPVAWYHGGAAELRLGEEWHFNRQTIVSGARLESVPYRDHPRWDPERVEQTVLRLLQNGQLQVDGLLQPRVSIARAAEAYRHMAEHPEETVKLTVDFTQP